MIQPLVMNAGPTCQTRNSTQSVFKIALIHTVCVQNKQMLPNMEVWFENFSIFKENFLSLAG